MFRDKETLRRHYQSIKETFELYNEVCDGELFKDFETDVISFEDAMIPLDEIAGYFAMDVEAEFCSRLFEQISDDTGIPLKSIQGRLVEHFDIYDHTPECDGHCGLNGFSSNPEDYYNYPGKQK